MIRLCIALTIDSFTDTIDSLTDSQSLALGWQVIDSTLRIYRSFAHATRIKSRPLLCNDILLVDIVGDLDLDLGPGVQVETALLANDIDKINKTSFQHAASIAQWKFHASWFLTEILFLSQQWESDSRAYFVLVESLFFFIIIIIFFSRQLFLKPYGLVQNNFAYKTISLAWFSEYSCWE